MGGTARAHTDTEADDVQARLTHQAGDEAKDGANASAAEKASKLAINRPKKQELAGQVKIKNQVHIAKRPSVSDTVENKRDGKSPY